jgi:hypothetical protein
MFKKVTLPFKVQRHFEKLGDHVSSFFFVIFIAAESGYGSRRVKTLRTHADPDPKHRILPCLYIGQRPNYSMSIPFFYVVLVRGMLCFAKN